MGQKAARGREPWGSTSARPMAALLVYGWWGESRKVTQYSTRENVKTWGAEMQGENVCENVKRGDHPTNTLRPGFVCLFAGLLATLTVEVAHSRFHRTPPPDKKALEAPRPTYQSTIG